MLIAGCSDDQEPLGPELREPAFVVTSNGGCIPEVITTGQDSTETLLFTFTVPEGCLFQADGLLRGLIDGSSYGVDFGDPQGTESPSGNVAYLAQEDDNYLNLPSPQTLAKAYDNGVYQSMIEFDPPVRSIEFFYSKWTDGPAWWGGQLVEVDSMRVFAMDRNRFILDVLTLHANSVRFMVDGWDLAQLTASSDRIAWLWFDGQIWIDDLKITRAFKCPDYPYFHDPAFRSDVQDLWDRSNPVRDANDPISESIEHGGWIVPEGDSYGIVEWTGAGHQCGRKMTPGAPPGTVGMLHTHQLANDVEFVDAPYCGHKPREKWGFCPFPSKEDKDIASEYPTIPSFIIDWNGVKEIMTDRTWINKPACINDEEIPEEPLTPGCEKKKDL